MPRRKLAMFYIKMVITYWLVTAIVIIILIPVYQKSLRDDKMNIMNQISNGVQLRYSNLTKQLKFLPSVAESINRNSCIHNLSQIGDEENDKIASLLFEAYMDQQHYLWATPVNAACCMVQFRNNETLITNQAVYASKEFFYNNFYNIPMTSFEKWQSELWESEKRIEFIEGININNRSLNAILYNYYYPSARNPHTIVTFVIDAESIQQELLTEQLSNYGRIEVLLYSGNQSITLEMGKETADNEIQVFSQVSSGSALTAYIHEDAFIESRKESFHNLFGYIVPAVISAIMLSLGCAFFYTKPLAKIMNLLNIRRGSSSIRQSMYNDICAAFDEIINDNNAYAQEKEIFRDELFRIIIRLSAENSIVSGENLNRLTDNIPALKGSYCILAIEFSSAGSIQNAQLLSRLIPMFANSFTVDSDTITYVIIPATPNGNEDSVVYRIESVMSDFVEENISVCFGVSPFCDDVQLLPRLFEYSREALLQAYLKSGNKIAVYTDATINKPENEILDTERFLWIIENGDKEMLEVFWKELLTELNHCTSQMLEAKMTFYTILRMLRKEAVVYSLGFELKEYDANSTLLKNMNRMKSCASEIQELITEKRIELQNNVVNDVLDYIHEHAFSDELSLTLIAEQFKFSERYIYKIIQEQTGMSYIEYVLLLRLQEAKRLLMMSDMPIKDIATSVGYSNIGSFNRMFKNKIGKTPLDFRREHRNGEGNETSE